MLYLAGSSNKTEKLAQLALQKAYALGFKYIEATDLMDNFQILANDKFGFKQLETSFIYTYNYNVPVNILPGSMGYQVNII